MFTGMNVLPASAPLGTLGLTSGDHWVRFHVEGDSISFEVAASAPVDEAASIAEAPRRMPTGFVQKWGGSAKKIESTEDLWLTRINEKHLR